LFTLSLHDALPICVPTVTLSPEQAERTVINNAKIIVYVTFFMNIPLNLLFFYSSFFREPFFQLTDSEVGNQCKYHRHDRTGNDQWIVVQRSEEHTSELQSRFDLVCRLLL